VEHREVDLATGRGLDGALEQVDTVIDAANRAGTGRRAAPVIVEGTRRLLAAERKAGVRHHVAISIVGIEKVPSSYYEAKVAQERVVREGGVPWTIVRATQFHELLAMAFAATARARLLIAPKVQLQPVDSRYVAEVLATTAQGEPLHSSQHVAGPQVQSLRELARTWRATTGRRAGIVALPLPRRFSAPLREGALVPAQAMTGGPTFAAWLAAPERGGGDLVSRDAASGRTLVRALRLTLAVVALSNAITGAQAVLGPRSFFDDYPLGRGWVAGLPPYNEHLTTDVGAFYLAFAVLLGWAAGAAAARSGAPSLGRVGAVLDHPYRLPHRQPGWARHGRRDRADDRLGRCAGAVRPGGGHVS
jgi:uncharacterized protein YbjT (DUF2867 family)